MRRGENIYKRKDGRWEGRYIKNRTHEGKIVYGYIYGRQYTEVKDRLNIIRSQTNIILIKNSSKPTLYCIWLEKVFFPILEKRIKASTYTTYYRLYKKNILTFFNQITFEELTEELLQEFISYLCEKGLKSNSIRLILSLVKQSISEAVHQKLLTINPIQRLQFPKQKSEKIIALELHQQKELEKLAKLSHDGLPIMISLYSGLRIGEICGLTWEDIDFELSLIRVNKTVNRVLSKTGGNKRTEVVISPPKTDFSNRLVPLSKTLSDYLKKVKKNSYSSYVVSVRDGLAEPRVVGYRFKKLISNTEFSEIHFHMLRHTFATRCIENNMDIVTLSRIMGHQSTKLTLDIYSDSLMEQRKKEILKIDNLF
ncbi:tyrosine-type recombinase/integrase [Enterococcus sp. HY326]|uniref:tyrosine-type recombinase/integrase n=1 Tax=Enterococcus sp. HY326 TaxID=2971265 RepID=UPI002240DC22|nr:site-specific integrase [Enterococcus sp. HY326]